MVGWRAKYSSFMKKRALCANFHVKACAKRQAARSLSQLLGLKPYGKRCVTKMKFYRRNCIAHEPTQAARSRAKEL
jgi:hypothetical protein